MFISDVKKWCLKVTSQYLVRNGRAKKTPKSKTKSDNESDAESDVQKLCMKVTSKSYFQTDI